jgi:hypothetical protein
MRDQIKRQIEKMQEAKANFAEKREKERKREMEQNGDYLRRKNLGHEGRVREAIEHQAKCLVERSEMFGGKKTFDEAKREATERAAKLDRQGRFDS